MAAISKSEYLKRYLSKDELPKEEKKKKKRRIKPSKDSKLKIIDDDVDFKKLKPDEIVEDDDEAPMVAEIIDERPKHIQQLEAYRKNSRWKVLGENEEDEISALEYGVINQSPSHKQKDMLNNKKRRRHDSSDSDTSPPRRNQDSGGKASSSKTNLKKSNKPQRHDSDSDASLPRKGKNNSDRPLQAKAGRAQSSSPDNSPPRAHKTSRACHDSDSDVSPPRKSSKVTAKNESHIDLDPSPPRKGRARHDSDSDPSPPRKRQPTSDSDQSPPRKMKAGSDSDASPPRKRRHDSDSDQSPPRKSQGSSKGAEDSRHRSRTSPSSSSKSSKSSRKSRFDSESREDGGRKATKTLAGAKAGLSSAKEMKEEAKKLRAKEDRSFQNLDEATLGKNARTVVRDKETGKKRDLKAEEEKSEEQRRKEEEQQKKYQQWGKGLKQQAMVDARLQDQVHEASKPLARYGDDKDLDQMLRNEEREEDPMLAFIRSKKKKEEEKSGKKKKELPKYKGTAPPPNRFNIMPGYRWDGVDRSNGFEKKIFASQANKKAIQEIAYKWSTEDM